MVFPISIQNVNDIQKVATILQASALNSKDSNIVVSLFQQNKSSQSKKQPLSSETTGGR